MFRHAVHPKCHVLSWSPVPPVPPPPRPGQHRARPSSITPASGPYRMHTSRAGLLPGRPEVRPGPASRSLRQARDRSFRHPGLDPGPTLVLAAASAVDPVLHRLRQAQTIRNGPRIKSRATVVAARCEAIEDGCANPAGLGGRGDERGLIDLRYPFCSIRRRLVRQAGPCFARIARGCGRVSAPARFARLIARARLRAYVSCPFLRGP